MNTKSLPDEVAAFLRDLANDLPALADELRAPVDHRDEHCGERCDFSTEVEIAQKQEKQYD